MTNTQPTQCFCGGQIPPGTDRCPRCGALHGAHRTCPFCSAKADIVPKSGHVFVCAACGKPRVPIELPGIALSGRERRSLMAAASAQGNGLMFGVFAAIAFVFVLFTALVSAIGLAFGSVPVAALAGVITLFLLAGAVASLVAVRQSSQLVERHAHEALVSAAVDAVRSMQSITPKDLAAQMGISETMSEHLLGEASAQSEFAIESSIDHAHEDGQVRYRVSEAGSPAAQEDEMQSFDRRLQQSMKRDVPH